MSILHILNGDSTLKSFEQTGLEGDIMVWREVLSEGPVQQDITSAGFWRARAEWVAGTFKETGEGYQEGMLDQLGKLSEPWDTINLWFEFDLHCQINLLGVMNFLNQKADLSLPAVYLICPADFPGKEYFMGMGELNGKELEYLYDTIRVQLNVMDFALAATAWDVYVAGDAKKLKKYLAETDFRGNLSLLKTALEAHLERLQVNGKGLNYIEAKLLDIYDSGLRTRHGIYAAFWKTEKIYGMGDAELDIYLNELETKNLVKL